MALEEGTACRINIGHAENDPLRYYIKTHFLHKVLHSQAALPVLKTTLNIEQ